MKQGLIVVISGPTGVGKTTVVKTLLKELPNSVHITSYTSRPPRAKEKDGIDYHFISKQEFKKQLKQGEFFEYHYIKNRDTYYGAKKQDIDLLLKKYDLVFFTPDNVGLQAIQNYYPDQHISIFLTFEILEDIKERIYQRQPNISEQELTRRLQNAKERAQYAHLYDHIIINKEGQLKTTVKKAKNFIEQALIDKKK
jgi:guanylate kinase